MRNRWLALAAALAAGAAPLSAQQPGDTVTVAPNAAYRAGAFKAFFLGDNWRELWTTPLRVPVLDLSTFAGGLVPERRGGGNQSITLHFEDAQGRGWIFRSIDKFPEQGLPEAFDGAPAGALVKDQISAQHPGGHFVLPALLEAVGVLHVQPELYVMPDDPRLGDLRETFAGMLGEIEIQPNEGPDDTPGFAGSRKIKGTEEFLNDLEESPEFRLDEREYLRTRLVDFVVGDADRTADNFRWVRFGEEGDYLYRPLPRDRDWAFMDAEALLMKLVRPVYPKLTEYDPEPSLHALTYGTHLLDRRLLTRLTREDFETAAAAVRGALSDDVIERATGDLPPELVPLNAPELASVMRARRDGLGETSLEFYRWLASDVDVRGTDAEDSAVVEVLGDGRVHVRLWALGHEPTIDENGDPEDGPAPAWRTGAPYYERVFLPRETGEVRLYLHGGDDHALVAGTGRSDIVVRVIGGGGDDVLEDRTGAARLYDHRGDNRFDTAAGTDVSTAPWREMDPPEGVRAGHDWVPDWGGSAGFGPAGGYEEGAGLIVGGSYRWTRYGFRHHPHELRASLTGLYATSSGGFGVEASLDHPFESSRLGLELEGRATQFEAFRFYGLGNDTRSLPDDESLVMQDQVSLYPALYWRLGPLPFRAEGEEEATEEGGRPFGMVGRVRPLGGSLSIGPHVLWTSPRVPADNPLSAAPAEPFGQVGARTVFSLGKTDRPAAPRRGFRLEASASAYPGIWTAEKAFGDVAGEANAFVPLVASSHLALRLGGERVWGEGFPPFESAFIGGRHTLRGFRWNRFAGDAAAYGAAELRVPLARVELFFKGELGAFGLADAGRVWVDGSSAGDWHTGLGGGLWFATLGRAVSAAWVQGERGQAYVWLGLPF